MAAASQGVYFVMQKPLLARYSALEFSAYAIWGGTIFLLVFTPGLVEAVVSAPVEASRRSPSWASSPRPWPR